MEAGTGSEPDEAANVVGSGARLAVEAERAGVVALGETAPLFVTDQAVVAVGGRGQAEEALEHHVDRRGAEEVVAAGDVGDALCGVVEDDGEVVGRPHLAAGEDDVADLGEEVAGEIAMCPVSPFGPAPVSVKAGGAGPRVASAAAMSRRRAVASGGDAVREVVRQVPG
jgi:hypothetical protein